MLTNLFEIGDVKLEQQEFFDEYFQEIIHYFFMIIMTILI